MLKFVDGISGKIMMFPGNSSMFLEFFSCVNVFLATKYSTKIKEDCSRLEGRLQCACGEVNNKFKYR